MWSAEAEEADNEVSERTTRITIEKERRNIPLFFFPLYNEQFLPDRVRAFTSP